MRRSPWMWPAAFVCVVAIATLAALYVIATMTQANIGSLDLNSQDLKVRLDEIRATLQFLITAAALFAIAQAAYAYFNAQTFTKQADDAVKKIENLSRDVQSRYPMFARTEEFRREAYAFLNDIFRDDFYLDWRSSAFERLDVTKRQRILSVERFISIDLTPHPGNEEEHARDLRRLANFYASKYKFDKAHGQAQWSDLERAEYYLRLALSTLGSEAYHLTTDLGVLYMEYYSPRRLSEAKAQFLASKNRNPKQQRACYNLALVARYEGDLNTAIEHLEEAETYPNWERRPIQEFHSALLYNLGCYCARASYVYPASSRQLVSKCLAALDRAARLGFIEPDVIENDLATEDGAFWGLDTKVKAEIEAKKSLLIQKQSAATPSGISLLRTAIAKLWSEIIKPAAKG